MRLLFLCNSLEPGRDGVGDYTSQLSAECTRAGHETALLSLNECGNDRMSGGKCLLRLGSEMPWSQRIELAKRFVDEFAPDWVSIQFVSYGFDPHGLAFGMASRLASVIGRRNVHLMIHELWRGDEIGAPLKERLIGTAQKFTLLRLIRDLRPRFIHTTNGAYQHRLKTCGVASSKLPLFGNIPLTLSPESPQRKQTDAWELCLFGTLHPVWPPEPLLTELLKSGKKVSLHHIGRMGAGEDLWREMERKYSGVIEFNRTGEISAEAISATLARMDFGIATTPYELVAKSGSVRAMLEHGLPVIVNRDDIHYRGWHEEDHSPLLIKTGTNLLERLEAARRGTPLRILPDVARQFLHDLA